MPHEDRRDLPTFDSHIMLQRLFDNQTMSGIHETKHLRNAIKCSKQIDKSV